MTDHPAPKIGDKVVIIACEFGGRHDRQTGTLKQIYTDGTFGVRLPICNCKKVEVIE